MTISGHSSNQVCRATIFAILLGAFTLFESISLIRAQDASRSGGNSENGLRPSLVLAQRQKAKTADKSSSDAQLDHVKSLICAGKLDEAISAYTELLKDNPGQTVYLRDRAICFEQSGRLKEAVADYSALLMQSPRDIEILLARSNCRMMQGGYQDALADLNVVRGIDGQSTVALFAKSICLDKLGQAEAAVENCATAIASNPRVHLSYLSRGLTQTSRPTDIAFLNFTHEFSGGNDPTVVERAWRDYEFAYVMSEGYYDYDRLGHLRYTMKSVDEFGAMKKRAAEKYGERLQRKSPPSADQLQLMKTSDADALQGSWLVCAVYQNGKRLEHDQKSRAAFLTWNQDRMEFSVNGTPLMAYHCAMQRVEKNLVAEAGENFRWWGTMDALLVGEPALVRGWYLYEPSQKGRDIELLAIKLSVGTKLRANEERYPKHGNESNWEFTLVALRDARIREVDGLVLKATPQSLGLRFPEDLVRLQGDWHLTEINGTKTNPPVLYRFHEDRLLKQMQIHDPGKQTPIFIEFGVSLNSAKSPKEIDWLNGDRRRSGIYEIDGDRLRLAHAPFNSNAARPADFRTSSGKSSEVMVLQRSSRR